MDSERDDYRDPSPTRPPRWLEVVAILLTVVALFGVDMAGAHVYYLVRDQLAD